MSDKRSQKTHYQVLGMTSTASVSEIRQQYQRLVLKHHPDKMLGEQSNEGQATAEFVEIQAAWEVLKDEQSRARYDQDLEVQRLKQAGPVTAEVDLDDMAFHESDPGGDAGGMYTHPCRCSGEYRITQQDLEAGFEVVGCSTCSLTIRVLYSVAEDDCG